LANQIQVKRGAFASLPTLAAGEFGFSTDAGAQKLHIGDGVANHEVVLHDLFNANTFLYAVSDNTPVVKTRAETVALLSGQSAADFAMNTHKITGVTDPTAAQDVATKAYADSVAVGLNDKKNSCRVATAAVLPACTPAGSGVGKTLTADAVGVLTVDGVATVLTDRILVKDQALGDNNGVYKVTTEGTAGVAFILTRATDFDADAEITAGAFTFIEEGTINGDYGFVLSTNNPITVDTTTLTFVVFSSAGAGVPKALFDANTFLYAASDDDPVAKTRAEVMALLSGNAGAEFLFNTQKIGGIVDPTTAQQGATKNYCDTRNIDGGAFA
jgi:hypothetical protein